MKQQLLQDIKEGVGLALELERAAWVRAFAYIDWRESLPPHKRFLLGIVEFVDETLCRSFVLFGFWMMVFLSIASLWLAYYTTPSWMIYLLIAILAPMMGYRMLVVQGRRKAARRKASHKR